MNRILGIPSWSRPLSQVLLVSLQIEHTHKKKTEFRIQLKFMLITLYANAVRVLKTLRSLLKLFTGMGDIL